MTLEDLETYLGAPLQKRPGDSGTDIEKEKTKSVFENLETSSVSHSSFTTLKTVDLFWTLAEQHFSCTARIVEICRLTSFLMPKARLG